MTPLKFRIKPLPEAHHYFEVIIFSSSTALRKFATSLGLTGPIIAGTHLREGEHLRKIGYIFFYPQSLVPDIIAHEVDHAATFYIGEYLHKRMRRIYTDPNADEFRAQMVARLNRQILDYL